MQEEEDAQADREPPETEEHPMGAHPGTEPEPEDMPQKSPGEEKRETL